jgi:hypothetical protein
VQVAMIAGSCATEACEPRQVRKEATVSSHFCVPRGRLVRVNYMDNVRKGKSTPGAQPLNIKHTICKDPIQGLFYYSLVIYTGLI